MKNLHLFTLLVAGVVLAVAIATYEPAPSSDGGMYSFTNSYGIAPVTDTPHPDMVQPTTKAVGDTSLPVSLTPAFSYTIGKVRLMGDEGTRPFPAELSVTELTAATLPPLDQGMVNVTDYAAGYRMLPDGMVFNGDISIVLPYDSTLLPAGFTPDDIVTYYYDVPSGRWTAIERDSVSTAEALVYSKVNHFTDFINAVIKTPEMPETSAFTPTSIKELEAANPLEGLQLIQAPTANNNGTANLSYQLEIPAGRQGMQPNLALTYSSSGGNGWLGVGWDISVPSITVETRWGVPRYDHEKESEVYLLNGEQLVEKDADGNHLPMPHRTNQWRDRSSSDTRFYPRADEAFDSIVRHKNATYDYWWSVTDRNGTTHYYGKNHNNDWTNPNSILKDSNGNIAYWALTESVDPNGNSVRYFYDVIQYNGGVELCLDSINYTGHNGELGKYSIIFNRQDNARPDATTDCRYGFKVNSSALLCNIQVLFDHDTIRTFYFVTENNIRESNYKTRLKHLVRMDGPVKENLDCSLSDQDMYLLIRKFDALCYDFDYYDYPSTDDLFSAPVSINIESDNITSSFLTQGFTSSALGATKGKSWSLGGTASIGLGANVALSSVSAGGNFDYSRSQSEGLLTLIDLNGDGLADKVYKKSGQVWFRPQIRDSETHFHFGTPVQLNGISDFLKETSNNIDWGLQLSALFNISGGWPTIKSTTSTYFADINNDGLPDLVTPAGALFNSLNSNGHPTFTHFNLIATTPPEGNSGQTLVVTSSSHCDGGIIFDGNVNSDLGCVMDCDTLYTEDNTQDSLAAWRERGYECFWLSYGKKLCGIRCTAMCDDASPDPDMDAVKVWVAQKTGWIDVMSDISMYPDTTESRRQSHFVDGVLYSIQMNSGNRMSGDSLLSQNDSVLWQGLIDTNDISRHLDTIRSIHVNKDDILFFRLRSMQNHSFDKVYWRQRIEYHGDSWEPDVYGRPENIYQSDSDFVLCGQSYFKATSGGTVRIDGTLEADNLNNTAVATIKRNGAAIYSRNLNAGTHCNIAVDTSFTVNNGDEIKCEVNVSGNGNTTWGNINFTPRIRFCGTFGGVTDTLTYYIPPKFRIHNYAGNALDTFYHKAFGPLYRGWGQFAYNNNYADTSASASKIRTERLRLPRWFLASSDSQIDTSDVYLNIDPNNVANEDSMSASFSSIYCPTSDSTSWVEMTANTEFGTWLGYGNITYISPDIMANTRCVGYSPVEDDEPASQTVIDDYDYPVPNSIAGANVNTIRKQNKSKLNNSSYGVSYMASVGQSESDGSNQVISDYMDMNGDGYPDFLASGNIQYTMPWGGIGQHLYCSPEHYSSESMTKSDGITFGASYSIPKRMPSNSAAKAKISFDGNGSVSASHGTGTDYTSYTYMDVNGDGLPDKIRKNASREVALNTGYGFLPWANMGNDFFNEGTSSNSGMSIGANFDIAQASIGGGLGVNVSTNNTVTSFVDMNGDGLPDYVTADGQDFRVSYNKGDGTFSQPDIIPALWRISCGESFSESVNAAVTAGFTFCSIAKVTAGVQASPFNRTFNRDSLQLVDINGDGFVDCVTSQSENKMTVRYNQAGKTNLLKKVTNCTESFVELDYELSASSYEQPTRSWNLAQVTTQDTWSPIPGNKTNTTFEYRNPHYDRYERMAFGYDTVITYQFDTEDDNSLYRFTVQGFNNHNFHKRGWKKSESVCDRNGHKYIETLYEQQLMDMVNGIPVGDSACPSSMYVSYEAEITRYYEGDSVPHIVTEIEREYDSHRNIIRYVNKGDTSRTDEYFSADISYCHGLGYNLISLPDTIMVKDKQNQLLQKRVAQYDALGNLITIKQFWGDSISRYDFYHNVYGSVDSLRMPRNYRGQRMGYAYEYDNVVHTYPVHTSDVFGYSSTASYDYRFGKPLTTTDLNGNVMRYHYDKWGRLDTLTGPNELAQNKPYTIRMQYLPNRNGSPNNNMSHISYALTFHYDQQHPTDPIQTIIFCDGVGRLLQTKKDAEVEGVAKLLNSGRVEYDCFGRTVKQYHPFASNFNDLAYNNYFDAATLTTTTYDILDRPVKMKLPTNDSTITTYGFDTHGGNTYFRTTAVDPNGIAVSTLTGTRKQQIKSIAPHGAVTTFTYDPLGQLLSSSDPCQHTTTYTYDMLGRMIQRVHPDAGTDTYTYDGAGNMTEHATQVLDNADKTIDYYYTYNRLDSIVYPYKKQNNVRYTYGDNTAGDNQRGRIVLLEDASGFQTFIYGRMGEVIENNRTFVLPNESYCYSFKMKYSYDSWNRVQDITYPDGEVVRYWYNSGGMLRQVQGEKSYLNTVIIDTFIVVPPGPVNPKNPSDEESDDLTTDTDTSGNGNRDFYQYYYYNYIDSIHYNEFELKSEQWYGNKTRTTYSYDVLMRLNHLAMYNSSNATLQNIAYTFDKANNVTQIYNSATPTGGLGGVYMYTYTYDSLYRLSGSTGIAVACTPFPNYTTSMQYMKDGRIAQKEWSGKTYLKGTLNGVNNNYTYTYNSSQPHTLASVNGVACQWDANGNMTGYGNDQLQWTEENRLWHVDMASSSRCAYYQYDAAGERFYKNAGTRQSIILNGNTSIFRIYGDPVLYVSPYVVATPEGYTKHYYVESERFASRIGDGTFPSINTHVVAATQLTAKQTKTNTSSPSYIVPNKFSVLRTLSSNWSSHHTTYWQHSDHLGSASWVTDTNGLGYQHLQYMPWGEQFIDKRVANNTYETRYTFSGKERDDETGYSYFGARYYNSDLSIWLSVDPLADKYPGVSPYTYCANNPVRLVDPDGREGIVVSGGEYDGSRYKYNFIEPAIKRLKELKSAGKDESITWVVMEAGYSNDDIANFKKVADDLGVGFQTVRSSDEFTNYLNSKNIAISSLSDAREEDKISSLTIFGHGLIGSIEFAYNQTCESDYSWGQRNVSQLKQAAFENAIIDLYTCNSATDSGNEKSLGYNLQIQTGAASVTGYRGQSTYSKMNIGQGFGDKWNRWTNGFNTNGSLHLPKAGDGATRIRYIPKT